MKKLKVEVADQCEARTRKAAASLMSQSLRDTSAEKNYEWRVRVTDDARDIYFDRTGKVIADPVVDPRDY